MKAQGIAPCRRSWRARWRACGTACPRRRRGCWPRCAPWTCLRWCPTPGATPAPSRVRSTGWWASRRPQQELGHQRGPPYLAQHSHTSTRGMRFMTECTYSEGQLSILLCACASCIGRHCRKVGAAGYASLVRLVCLWRCSPSERIYDWTHRTCNKFCCACTVGREFGRLFMYLVADILCRSRSA